MGSALPGQFRSRQHGSALERPQILEGGGEGREEAMGFLRMFLNYGLVVAVLVWAAVVAMMAYHLDESPWRWAFAALSVGGLVTVAGIFWIRKYVDGLNKASEQQGKS